MFQYLLSVTKEILSFSASQPLPVAGSTSRNMNHWEIMQKEFDNIIAEAKGLEFEQTKLYADGLSFLLFDPGLVTCNQCNQSGITDGSAKFPHKHKEAVVTGS